MPPRDPIPERSASLPSHLAAYLRSFTGLEPMEADLAHFAAFVLQARKRNIAVA
jgi:hypothetical protein